MFTTCVTCGRPVPADAAFCVGCGRRMPRSCSACGAALGDSDKWCAACGAKAAEAAAGHSTPAASPLQPPPPPGLVPYWPTSAAAYAAQVAPARGRVRRSPVAIALVGIAAVVVLAAGALGTGLIKLPGTATDSVGTPPPIDNMATPAQGTLTLGDSEPVASLPVAASGASVTVSAPGKAWNGIELDVPAGAWTGSTLQVTAQTIEGSTFGDLITPITPFYTVSGAEGMAPAPVSIKIPATIPDDSFAMGFYYDAAAGTLEGMPLLAEDATSLTVATEHFSGYFGSLVKRTLLRTAIDSGFRPGKDNWQFKNDGSYLSPNGICAGISLTEAWYYIERRMTGDGSPLYGLFDNNGEQKTPDLWEDDSRGYRLASVAHAQYDANAGPGTIDNFFKSWRGLGFDTLQYNAFRYAIAVTGEPQLVSISDAQDESGHAMLVYRVVPSGLFVADPNYPTGWRLIPFDSQSGKFGTYVSAANARDIAEGHGTTYVNFVYKAKTALVDWATLGADWAAFDAGTIGDSLFPKYSLEAKDQNGNFVPLVDGFRTANRTLAIRLVDTQQKGLTRMVIYPGTSADPWVDAPNDTEIDLEAGSNPLGFLIKGNKPNDPLSWVDFVRLTIAVGPAVSPTIAAGRWHKTDTVPLKGASGSTDGELVDRNMDDGSTPTASWGPPPDDVSPGGDWTTELTVSANASLSVYCDYYVGSVAHHQEWVISSPGTKTLSFKFPAYGSGVEFYGFVVKATAGPLSDTWTYYYDWMK